MEKFKEAFRKTQGYAAFKGSLMRDEAIFSRENGAFKLPYVQDCFISFSVGLVSVALQPKEAPAPVAYDMTEDFARLEVLMHAHWAKLRPKRIVDVPSHFDFEGEDLLAADALFKKAGKL